MSKLEIYLITLITILMRPNLSIRNNILSRSRDRKRKWRYDCDYTISVTHRESIPIVEHANAWELSTFVCVTTNTVSPASLTALHSLVSIASESIATINRVLRRRIYFPSDNLFTSGTSIPVSFSMRHFAADRRCNVSAEEGTVKTVPYPDFSRSIS